MADTSSSGSTVARTVLGAPEPGTWATMLVGVALAAGLARRKRAKRA